MRLLHEPTIELFVSYSHRDEELMQELVKHLSVLKRQGVIRTWHDRQIAAGTEWEGQIDEHLNSAQVILLLISPDFMASDYCYDVELSCAMARHESQSACVIPVILRPVDWRGVSFGKLQSLPKDAKPITSWANRDEAFLNVTQGIRAAVEALSVQVSGTSSAQRLSPIPIGTSQQLRVKNEIDSLQEMHSLFSEKLRRLRCDWTTQAGTAVAYQIEKEIEEIETKCANIDRRLTELGG